MPEGARAQFLAGKWNPMAELLAQAPEVDRLAASLPYVAGHWT
jgi:hypothetical protein